MAKRKFETRKTTISDAVSDAFGEFQSLGEEMREWEGNMADKFSSTEKYSRVDEAASALENLSEPDIPDDIGKLEVEITTILPRSKRSALSRADRCSNACIAIDCCIGILDNHEDNEDAVQLRDDLDNAKCEAEAIEFPGMFG